MAKFRKGRVSSTNWPRPGWPCLSCTDANKERVGNLILSDRWVTLEDICAHTGLTYGTVMRIIKEDLQMTKVSARWVPKMLDKSKKEIRITCSEEMLTRHHSDLHFLEKLVTMDETWIPLFNPETKRQSERWKHSHSPPPKKFRVGASLFNFLGPEGHYSLISSPKGHDHHRRMLQRHFEESVVACSCRKVTWIGGELHPPSRQRSTTQGSNSHRIPGGTGNWDTSTSSLFTWPCSERFLDVWHPETLFSRKTISFEIKSRFSSLPVSKTHT